MFSPSKIDPTRSITLRRSFSQGLTTTFARLRKEIYDLLVNEDAFGLKSPTLNQRWQYKSQSEAVEEFDRWLKDRVAKTLLSPEEARKWQKYIERGFVKGAARAFDDTSKVRKTVVADTARGSGFVEGNREGFLRTALGKSTAAEKLRLLQQRGFSEVVGMTRDLRTKGKRILTDGLVKGQNPSMIAKTLSKELDISKGRAETIAFTELVRAHADGQLEAMEQLGVDQVGIAVEWSTADNPCPLCEVMEGVVLSVIEARGMLPRHPRCKCAWLPANIGEDTGSQKRGKYKIDRAIKSSQKREGTKEWGPDKRIAKKRPQSVFNVACTCSEIEFERLMRNVFCPTGPGGGIDPTCSPVGTKSSDVSFTPKVHKISSTLRLTRGSLEQPYVLKHRIRGDILQISVEVDGEKLRISDIRSTDDSQITDRLVNKIGVKTLLKVRKALLSDYPNVKRITGTRAFGRVRGGQDIDLSMEQKKYDG